MKSNKDGSSTPVSGENSLDHIHIDKDNGETPVASDKLNAEAISFRIHGVQLKSIIKEI